MYKHEANNFTKYTNMLLYIIHKTIYGLVLKMMRLFVYFLKYVSQLLLLLMYPKHTVNPACRRCTARTSLGRGSRSWRPTLTRNLTRDASELGWTSNGLSVAADRLLCELFLCTFVGCFWAPLIAQLRRNSTKVNSNSCKKLRYRI